MIVLGTIQRSWLRVFKNPADALAPYKVEMRLPDGRSYRGRMRSHPNSAGGFWYEGFVTAERAQGYAHDQQLVRYPVMPALAPARWNLLPCQMKINPYPVGDDVDGLIGSVWVSRADGVQGGELFTILGQHHHQGSLVIAGDVRRYRQPRRDKHDASRVAHDYSYAA